jgi:2-polyprenyl-3-methyl-5-hydroxy-6-metoxy-1,4-benzoquinol methylase
VTEETGSPADLTRARWEANAGYWVRVIRERRDRYRTELTDAAVLEAIGACAGRTVLDAGCGEGYLARELASRGAAVIGVDVTHGLVSAATNPPADHSAPASNAPVSYACASVDALPLGDAAVDLVVGNHLFSHLHDPAGAIREFGRVLRSGGRLVILTLHPCFYVEHAETGARDGVPASRYFASRGIDQHFQVDGLESPSKITSWLRPLEYYSTTLRESGFVLTDLREPHPTDEQLQHDPWWRDAFPAPLFILLTAERR